MNYQLGIIRGPALEPPYPVIWPSISMLGLSLLRLSIGLVVIYTTKELIKYAANVALRGLIRSKTMSYVVSNKITGPKSMPSCLFHVPIRSLLIQCMFYL